MKKGSRFSLTPFLLLKDADEAAPANRKFFAKDQWTFGISALWTEFLISRLLFPTLASNHTFLLQLEFSFLFSDS